MLRGKSIVNADNNAVYVLEQRRSPKSVVERSSENEATAMKVDHDRVSVASGYTTLVVGRSVEVKRDGFRAVRQGGNMSDEGRLWWSGIVEIMQAHANLHEETPRASLYQEPFA